MENRPIEKIAELLWARLQPFLKSRSGIVPMLMDTKTCAALLGMTDRALRHLRQRQQIPFVKINRRVMYEKSQIEKWIARRRKRR